MQEKYGHPAGCTLAQIICESGAGDHLSLLAERDKNLFGIKWAWSPLRLPGGRGQELVGHQQQEYGGQVVGIMADFTVFKGHRECIVFRSRVLLANSRYAGNALIQQAIAEKLRQDGGGLEGRGLRHLLGLRGIPQIGHGRLRAAPFRRHEP